MIKQYYKCAITVEASILITVGIYILLFLIDLSMFLYDGIILNTNMVRAGLRVQNTIECNSNIDSKMIDNISEKYSDEQIRKKFNDIIKQGYMYSKLEDSNIEIGILNIEFKAKIKHIGIVFPFKNIEITKIVKMPRLSPASDIRKNKEILNIGS